MWGTEQNLVEALLVYPLAQILPLRPRLIENFNLDNLCSKQRCHVVTKAFSTCKNTGAADMFLLKFKVTWSVSLIHWSVGLWRARKPNWLALSRPLYSLCLSTNFNITFSNSLPVVGKRLIGHKLSGNFGFLWDFGNVLTFASFRGSGKWDSRRLWLNKCVKVYQWSSWKKPEGFVWNAIKSRSLSQFQFIYFMYVTGS
jgi:hypothetical protein